MKGNVISANKLTTNAENWVSKLVHVLTIKRVWCRYDQSYCNVMALLFKYYHHKDVETLRPELVNLLTRVDNMLNPFGICAGSALTFV
ncbi:MAG: hypothetical protein R2774_03865 [Saprospiraceae bacterium]